MPSFQSLTVSRAPSARLLTPLRLHCDASFATWCNTFANSSPLPTPIRTPPLPQATTPSHSWTLLSPRHSRFTERTQLSSSSPHFHPASDPLSFPFLDSPISQ